MNIVFTKVRWKNLLSTGNVFTEIDLCKHPTTLIVGNNGGGKSTILDALSFGLYGKPFRKINKPQLLNSINKKDLVVEVEFKIGKREYIIKRGIKPNYFEIWQDGKMRDQDAAITDYQEHLEKNILKLNHKSFTQVVVLGASTFVPFMQLSAGDRRKVIEDLLDIQIFSVMNTLLKERIQKIKLDKNELKYQLSNIESHIKLHTQHLAELEQTNQKQVEQNKRKIKEATNNIECIRQLINKHMSTIDDLNEQISDYDSVKKALSEYKETRVSLHEKIKKLQSNIKFFNDNDNCPTCKQEIDSDFRQEAVDKRHKQQEDVNKAVSIVETKLAKFEERIDEIRQIQLEISKYQTEVNTQNGAISVQQSVIAELNNDLQNTHFDKAELAAKKDEIKKLRQDQKELKDKGKKIAENSEILAAASVLLKDGGIKTRIVKQYIPIMNKLVNKYLAAMDFYVKFELDENFKETIKSRFRDEFSYHSFSEGEKLRIDLALLFTWRAVSKLRNSASTNLLIMDEVFDSSLDTTGTDDFMKILSDLASETNVFIISHKTDTIMDKFSNVIKFEKVKNFSKMVEV